MNRVVAIAGVISLYSAAYAMGAELTDQTRCVDAIKRFDPPRTGLSELADYIKNVMELLDRKHTENGEPGIIAQLPDDGFWNLVGSTTVWCRDHPRQTVYNAAAFVYTGSRELEIELGAAK